MAGPIPPLFVKTALLYAMDESELPGVVSLMICAFASTDMVPLQIKSVPTPSCKINLEGEVVIISVPPMFTTT